MREKYRNIDIEREGIYVDGLRRFPTQISDAALCAVACYKIPVYGEGDCYVVTI